ncbi:MAG TPA: histidine phosphatase family protein [Streptosporangiaceae bacterium]|jgi:phosphohistidine phosphatase|nr:histidine phosphatase family protein [Streptosporangiaceae bacterium]
MGVEETRRLVLLRHAKSAWPDVADAERPLANRGRRDAPVVGRWLRRSGYVPDAVLCSPARRTRETWALVAAELGAEPPVSYEQRIYQATALGLLHLLREAGGEYRTVLLIGHNPGLAELAVGIAQVTDGPELGPLERARAKFPTAAVAVLEFSGDWAGLTPGEARMVDFAVPCDMSS